MYNHEYCCARSCIVFWCKWVLFIFYVPSSHEKNHYVCCSIKVKVPVSQPFSMNEVFNLIYTVNINTSWLWSYWRFRQGFFNTEIIEPDFRTAPWVVLFCNSSKLLYKVSSCCKSFFVGKLADLLLSWDF